MVIGYARVSTNGQDLANQLAALETAGCVKVYREKLSGARSDRPQLAKALAALDEGDVLLVTRLDRLARSTRDLLNIVHAIGERGAAFKSLADAWADTTTPHGKLMLTILAGLAEFERSLISARTAAGRARQGQRRAVRPKAEAERTPARACVEAARRRRAAIGGRAGARRRSINDLALGCARLGRNTFRCFGEIAPEGL